MLPADSAIVSVALCPPRLGVFDQQARSWRTERNQDGDWQIGDSSFYDPLNDLYVLIYTYIYICLYHIMIKLTDESLIDITLIN